ncbi:hypothetical protein M407DRAFT_7225 [Tulasnella calospora MUT 4182]|uniref:F-box domain-containing protein n=1 Tax=Tulasnella calospora MUT 4182 TaxID=1051891 RepID=A0A0C3QAY7_9AGAM|nr:hypothetical protein M407DRAFT_7225 [Tulasnella calospora MUT 4182]
MYSKDIDLRRIPNHLQDTEFLRGLQRDLEATSAPHVPRSQHSARDALAVLERSLHARGYFCACGTLENSDSAREPDSDLEDESYCVLSHITESDNFFGDAHFTTTLRAVLRTLQASRGFDPSSIVERIITRLELEEMQRQKKTDISRKHHRSPSLSSSLSTGSHTFTQFIHGMELLPPELVYGIISFARQFDQHIHITLSQVNRFFRSLVNSSPLLWTKIDFLYPIPLISLYIERSARSPLEIIADDASTIGLWAMEQVDRTSECLALLRPHRDRIHRLRVRDFEAQFWGLDMRDMTRVPQPRPDPRDNFLWCFALCNLETLDLDFGGWEIHGSIVFPPVTNLRKLRLGGPWSRYYLPLFAPQLEFLALANCSVGLSVLLEALRRTPALEHLALSDFFIQPYKPTPGQGSQTVLQNISLPELSALTIRFASEAGALPTNHVVDVTGVELFTQAQPTIQQLDISAFHANDSFLKATLQRLPGLNHLRIASAWLRDDHLLLLSVGNINEVPLTHVLCPQLTSLTVENEFDITSKAIRRVADSRHTASIPLKTLTLRGLDGTRVAADDIESLAAYGVTKLTVDIFYAEFSGESDWPGSEEEDSSEEETRSEGD